MKKRTDHARHGHYGRHGREFGGRPCRATPDITDRHRVQEALQQSEVRYRTLVENTPDVITRYDRHFRCLYVNPSIEPILGLKPEQLVGRTLREICLTLRHLPEATIREQVALREAAITQVFDTRQPIQAEFEFMGPAGRITLEWRAVPELDAAGNVVSVLSISRDISQRRAMEEERRVAALSDQLTGLPNRALLCDRLQQAILRSKRRNDYQYAVLFVDIDRFKSINDVLGHEVGDQVLKEIGRRLKATVRSGDSLSRHVCTHTVARLGGDEFVILLDGLAAPQDAASVAGRLLEALAQPCHVDGHEICATASIGIVTAGTSFDSADDVLRDADTAMYEAKLAGKGRYVVFDASMRHRVQNRWQLENDLRKALDAGQLFLMYQPIVSLETGQVESIEALARWKHPERGLISPGEFIPIAEDTGLILPIGEWILREACRQFVQWQESLGRAAPPSISINLSRKQLSLPVLPQTIRRIVEQSGMTPGSLHLEITESAVMKDPAAATSMLHAIKAIGVKLDMDDFGTGYSSLACLHEFPLDVLKIDRAFVANLERGRDFVALVEAVVHLARNLNIRVVGEGIETVDQLLTLQALGCEFGQGYFFSKPLMADQVPAFTVRPVRLCLPGVALSGYGQEQDIARSREAGFAMHPVKPTSPDRLAEAVAAAAGRQR